jgi:predicted HTH domain antitoxin
MNITLHIPESIARSLHIPEGEGEQRLLQELAVALYARGLLSFGKASELAGTSRFLFADILTQRNVARHYGKEELSEDLTYADGE